MNNITMSFHCMRLLKTCWQTLNTQWHIYITTTNNNNDNDNNNNFATREQRFKSACQTFWHQWHDLLKYVFRCIRIISSFVNIVYDDDNLTWINAVSLIARGDGCHCIRVFLGGGSDWEFFINDHDTFEYLIWF